LRLHDGLVFDSQELEDGFFCVFEAQFFRSQFPGIDTLPKHYCEQSLLVGGAEATWLRHLLGVLALHPQVFAHSVPIVSRQAALLEASCLLRFLAAALDQCDLILDCVFLWKLLLRVALLAQNVVLLAPCRRLDSMVGLPNNF